MRHDARRGPPKRPGPKILEIGPTPFMWHAFPDSTAFYSTWYDESLQHGTEVTDAIRERQPDRHVVSLASLPSLARRLGDGSLELIVVHAPPFSPLGFHALSRALFRRSVVRGNLAVFRGVGPQLLRGPVAAPVAILDLDDPTTIARCNRFLLDKAVVYFKRELPIDHWLAFAGTLHRRVPTPRFRAAPRNRARIAKLRPISLGMPFEVARKLTVLPRVDKTIDVFFAGRICDSATVRAGGFEELVALRREGCVIDVSEDRLPLDEYLARCARAYLVWSPPGFGWQCFRTYEAAACGAVALCGRSPIERYQPLIDGVHAIYYDIEPGGLTRAIRSALSDRGRLRTMGTVAREHALACHTPTAIARHVFQAAINMAAPSSPTPLA